MYRGKGLLESKELKQIYNALILPHLNYCSLVWGINFWTNLQRIEILQKRAARVILNLGFRDHVYQRFDEIGIQTFHQLLHLKCMITIYKIKNGMYPQHLNSLLSWKPLGNHALRRQELLEVPFARTVYKQNTFRIYASKLCNALNANSRINFNTPISTFKRIIRESIRQNLNN